MKRFFALSFVLVGLCQPLMADIFVEYNFNNVPTVDSPNVPSYLSPCIEASDLSVCTLTSGLRTSCLTKNDTGEA